MKIYKPIGSKERFVEVFQRVNKVKLNENLMEAGSPNLNPENVLNVAFNQLKNNQLKIEHSNTQEKGDENFVELLCTDNQGNNITFIFRAISSEGDQEGVYNISNVLLNSFSFDSPDGQDTLDLDENGLKQFNMQHAREMMDVIDKYVDVANPETAELEEAVRLIDAIKQNSYPFGGGDDRLQTGKNYGDKKPTNDKVRVSSPELDKFVQEDINPVAGGVNPVASVGGKITDLKALGRKLTKEDVPNLSKEVLYKVAMSLANKMLPLSWDDLADVNSMWDYIREGMTFDQLKVNVKKAVNKRLKEEGYSLKDLGLGENLQEFDKPAQKLVIPQEVHENEDDDVVGQEVNRFKQEIQPQNPEEVDVEDEPVPEVSPEKKDKIFAAYDSLTARNKSGYAPTTAEVMAELDKMSGKVTKKTPRPPINFDDYVVDENSEESKQNLIMQAAKSVAENLKRTGQSYVYEEFIPLVKEEALKMYNNMQRMSLAETKDKKMSDYPEPLGKEFEPKPNFPKPRKKHSKKVKLGEQEVYGDEDISGLPNPPTGYGSKGVAKKDMTPEFGRPDNKNTSFNKQQLPYDTKFDFNEDDEEKPEGDEKSRLPGVDSDDEGNPIPAIEPDFGKMGLEPQNDDGMSHEPEGDEIEQIAQDKEEAGEMIPGGNGEGKSPSEFSPDQILMGMKVEMEHSDDPMYALEITMDHLAEDPEYYTEKDTPETSAQFGAAKDTEDGGDKEMTDVLLGFKPHNVGDEVDIEGDKEPEVTPAEEPEPANEPEKTPAEEVPAEEPEEKEKLSEGKKVITDEQIKIAKTTLNRNIPTGMTKKEAVTILMNNNLRKIL
jgi:hypothetical protein